MIDLNRRALVTGLAAVAASRAIPTLPASASAPAALPVQRLFLYKEDEATRWRFLERVSDPLSGYSIEQLMPSSLWDFDAHLDFDLDKQLFSLRHVASGFTFRQVHASTPAFRFDYWDTFDIEPFSWVDTADIALIGGAAVCALAGIFCRPTWPVESPFRVRFSPLPFSCLTTPVVTEIHAASPLDHYPHADD